MDVLSDVVGSMRTPPARFIRSRQRAGWGHRFGPYRGAGFHLVLAGSCWLVRDDSQPVELRAGDVLLLPHGSAHGLADRPDARPHLLAPDPGPSEPRSTLPAGEVRVDLLCGAYEIDRALVHPLLRSMPEVVVVSTGAQYADLHAAAGLLVGELATDRPGSAATRAALLDLVLVFLLRTWLDSQAEAHPGAGWPALLVDPALAVALDRVHDDPAHAWSVDELAAVAGMSRTAFARRFSKTVGQSPMAYVTWWRLSLAARALAATDAPLTRIAHDVGYSSAYAFAGAFRRETGTAPGRFRREQREAAASDEGAAGLPDEPPSGSSGATARDVTT